MRLVAVHGDITDQAAGAIVNAANSSLLGGAGVDGAIHAVGGPAILAACRQLRVTKFPDGLPTGQAVATTAGDLRARWVIHTVGPVYSVFEDRSQLLRRCYVESLRVADELGAMTVAFPLISAGAYGWPLLAAVNEAVSALDSAVTAVSEARMVLFSTSAFEISKAVIAERFAAPQ